MPPKKKSSLRAYRDALYELRFYFESAHGRVDEFMWQTLCTNTAVRMRAAETPDLTRAQVLRLLHDTWHTLILQ